MTLLSMPAWPNFTGFRISVAAGVVSFALLSAGCGDDDVRPEPVELQTFTPSASYSKSWSENIGDGYDDEALSLSPLLVDTSIFAVSRDGELKALDRTTGETLWERDLDVEISGGVGGTAGELYLTTPDGVLIAVSATDGSDIWQVDIDSEVLSAPLRVKDLIVVQSIDGVVSAYETNDGLKRWEYREEEPALTVRGTSPLTYDSRSDLVLAGFANGSVVGLEPRSGVPAWSQLVAEPRGKTELDRLIDVDGGVSVARGEVYAVAYQGNIASLSSIRGRVDWLEKASSFNTPAVDSDLILLTAENGDVIAWDESTKTQLWRTSEYAYRELSSAALIGRHAVFGDLEGYVHVLSLSSGKTVARFRPADEAILTAPIAVDGVLYVYGSDGELSAWSLDE